MKPSSGRPVRQNPYWKPQDDALYSEMAFALEWLKPVWLEDTYNVPDDWDPSLGEREQSAYYKAFWQQSSCRGVTS